MSTRIPEEKKAIHNEIAALLSKFGSEHLDPELTGFTLNLWAKVCRTSKLDPRRGRPGIWAAAVVHAIASINFCYDRTQPVFFSLDLLASYFGGAKNSISNKAADIGKILNVNNSDKDFCRASFRDSFTMVQLSNGMVLTLKMAKEMGLIPPES